MLLVKNGKKYAEVFVIENASQTLLYAAQAFIDAVTAVTGVTLSLRALPAFTGTETGVVLATFSQVQADPFFESWSEKCKNDGFCAVKKGNAVYLLSHLERGVVYGAHDLLEKNAEIVWARGANEERLCALKKKTLVLKNYDYAENSPFTVRAWNLCGIGTEGEGHADEGTLAYTGANKSNAVAHRFETRWEKYGLFGSGVILEELANIDYLSAEHPEWFMTAPDGGVMPALNGWDSYLNYYNADLAKAFGRMLAACAEKLGEGNLGHWNMPDNPYFCMVQGGVKLHEQPFTADDGTTVYPADKNYKSTVYFNFLNRVMQEANAVRPNTYLHVFAYTYSEETPAIEVDKRLIITLAPICTNDKYAYSDISNHDNDGIRDNIVRWSKKTENLELYTYWSSFRGEIYSRPNLEVVKQNLLWFESLGIKRVQIEGRVDCSLIENRTGKQENGVRFYDMNEAYLWAMHKLTWNPRQDTDCLIDKFCKAVYKESAPQMQKYFRLLKRGWEQMYGLVWYNTGGDVYYLQFLIKAGLAQAVLKTLRKALRKAKTPAVQRKITAVLQTVETEIEKYKDFEREEAEAVYTDIGEDELLCKRQLDYIGNPQSEWHKAKPLTVLRYCDTMQYYPKEADFSCRMLYDDKNIYIGYTVFDDEVGEEKITADGKKRYYRGNGKEMISYAETYIGGNSFNQDTYYGYISGFMAEREEQWYENKGSPERKPIPQGVRTVQFMQLSDDPKKRYCFQVQVIPYTALGATADSCTPYGSFVYYTDRFGRGGWMGYGLWCKPNFSSYRLKERDKGGEK